MHNIQYCTYKENCDRKKVKAEIDKYVAYEDRQEGCSGLYRPIRWLETNVYETYEEAEKAIGKLDRGDYDNLAVKYKEWIWPENDAKLDDLKIARASAHNEYIAREMKLYPETLTSAFLGCKNCGSRLAVKLLKTNSCPVCHEDLRPESTKKAIASAKTRWDRAEQKVDEYITKHSKAEICWLLKYEYHT